MISVTFSPSVGGDGSSFNDGTGAGGMAEGGHLLYFFPLLVQYLAVASFIVSKAAAAADSAASAANAPGTSATTTTAITVGTGSKTFTLAQTGKLFSIGQTVVAASAANANNSITGPITAFNSATGVMTINATGTSGSGTFSDGVVSLSASGGIPVTRTISASGLAVGGGDFSANRTITVTAALSSDVRIGTDKTRAMTVGDTYDALVEVALQYGANITTSGDVSLDMSKFDNAAVTMAGNGALPNPVNHKPGMSGRIRFIQDATGSRQLSGWGSYYKADGGRPVLSTQPGAVDYLYYDVVSATEIMCSFVKAPTN